MALHLWLYHERYNTDPDYYSGDEDIYKRVTFSDLDDLVRCWSAIIHDYEGETYSLWDDVPHRKYTRVCGGALDPDDIEIIKEVLTHDTTGTADIG